MSSPRLALATARTATSASTGSSHPSLSLRLAVVSLSSCSRCPAIPVTKLKLGASVAPPHNFSSILAAARCGAAAPRHWIFRDSECRAGSAPLQLARRRPRILSLEVARSGQGGTAGGPEEDELLPEGQEPSAAPQQGVQPGAIWALFAAYIVWLFVLPYAPGDPAWQIQPSTLEEVTDLSLNFFFILPLLNLAGIHTMEAPSLHPTAEALFNFVNAWSLMFGPLLILDARRRGAQPSEGSTAALWSAQMFLTNVFLIPYMAQRLERRKHDVGDGSPSGMEGPMGMLAGYLLAGRQVLGAIGFVVASISAFWFINGRLGEGYGDMLTERWSYFVDYISGNRLAYAFVLDIVLYSVFQAWLINSNLDGSKGSKRIPVAIQGLTFVPCFGLGLFLLAF